MKILKNNYINQPQKIECYYCDSILEYSYDDVRKPDDDSEYYIVCPCCDKRIKLFGIEFNDEFDSDNEYDEDDEKILTVNNIVFPDDFYKSENAIHISDNEVQKTIKRQLEELERDEDDWGTYRYSSTGDVEVATYKHEDCYRMVVSYNTLDAEIYR